jgi:hypothetical protein
MWILFIVVPSSDELGSNALASIAVHTLVFARSERAATAAWQPTAETPLSTRMVQLRPQLRRCLSAGEHKWRCLLNTDHLAVRMPCSQLHGDEGSRWPQLSLPATLAIPHVGQQADQFLSHHGVAFASVLLEAAAIEYRDVTPAIVDQAGSLQFPGGFRDSLAAHPEHAGDQFLRHDQFVARQSIERHQQPAAELLLDGMVSIAGRDLRHLGHQGLR